MLNFLVPPGIDRIREHAIQEPQSMNAQPVPSRPTSRARYGRTLALLVTAAAALTFVYMFCFTSLPGGATVRGLCVAGTETDAPGENPPARTPEPQAAEPSVTVYITTWCPACTYTINYLKKERIPFTVKDIEKNPAYMDELVRKTGAYRGVPVLEIDGRTHLGFHPSLLDDLRRR